MQGASLTPRLTIPVALSAALLAGACSSETPSHECVGRSSEALKVCPGASTLKGVDVSYYQGTVDWAKVKAAGNTFAFVRVSDGKNTIDTKFAANWAGTRNAGLVRGLYQFFRPGQDPIVQADVLLTQLAAAGGMRPGDLPPVLDLETVDGQPTATIVARAKAWLTHVEAALKIRPIVYTAAFMSDVTGTHFSTYPLWVANYGATCPTMPTGWSKWRFWQNADNGSVPGVAGNVDTNLFDGTLTDLRAMTLQAPDAGPGDAGAPGPVVFDAGGAFASDASMGQGMGAGKPASEPPPLPPDPCAR